ncbi:MAG: phage holin family protein [Candidatus Paceibacterota bacterium]|jgi:phage-related holin
MLDNYFEYIVNIFISFKNCFDIKIVCSYLMIVFSFLFNLDAVDALAGLTIIILFDFITAIWANKKCGVQIESKKAIRSAFKVLVYGILISSSHLTDKALGITDWKISLEFAMTSFLFISELISIIENVGLMGYMIPKKMLNSLKNYTGSCDCKLK